MKKLLFSFVGAAAFAALASDPSAGANDIDVLGFENFDLNSANVTGAVVDRDDTGVEGTSKWSCSGDDASLVKTYGGDNATKGSGLSYPGPFSNEGDQYLALDTNGSELQRAIPAGGQTITDGTYIDTLVQFTPSESEPGDGDLTGAKLAIWLGVSTNAVPTTNLYVKAGIIDSEGALTPHSYKLNGTAVPGQWYRLTVTALKNIMAKPAEQMQQDGYLNGFQIRLDGTLLEAADDTVFNDAYITGTVCDADWGWLNIDGDAETIAFMRSNTVFPSLAGVGEMSATLTSIGFKGTGAIDDFVVTTQAPEFGPATIDFSLSWPAGLTAVSYQIGENAAVSLSGETSPFAVPGLAGGETVKLIVQNADGAQKTLSATAADGEGIDATGTTFGWPEYLGDAVSGAYQIDDFADLDMLRKGVAAGLTTANETFKQTADIDMTSAGAFAGIGTFSKVPTAGTPFLGTYDGQGYMIANVTRAGGNTQGIFNQVGVSGVIENLIVSNMVVAAGTTGEYGFAIVGNAGGGATLRNLTAAGTFSSAAQNSTHNIAGIVVRVCGGATEGAATTIDSCTNNATIYGGYTKLGGICAIAQTQSGFAAGKVVFNNCANNGTLISKRTAQDITGTAGIVAYSSAIVELAGCFSNGVITNNDGANTDKDAALVGWQYSGYAFTDNGGNSAPANVKMVAYYGNVANVTGFKYATVDNGVATTVTTLAKDTTYLLEGNVAASETPVFTLAAAGDYIEFDAALGYTFAGTIAGEGVTNETTGTVTKYWIPSAEPPAGDYEVVIDGSDVTITPTADDFAAIAPYVDTNDVAAVNALLAQPITGTTIPNWQALFLGVEPTTNGLKQVAIKSISFNADGNVEVVMADGVTLKTGRGVDIKLKLMGSTDLSTWTQIGSDITNTKVIPAVTPGSGETKKFYKVVVDFAGSQN